MPDDVQIPSSLTVETVEAVKHWTDELFSFRLTRPQGFRFRSGEFVMLGLMNGPKPLLRAYSIVSPAWDEGLDFYSIKVQDGPLTSRLQNIQVGDSVLLGKKPTGTLVLDALKPGKRLYMFSTGTGFAPFGSVIREPETFEKFEDVIVTHTGRWARDLEYSKDMVETINSDEILSEITDGRLRSYASATREAYEHEGRITTLIETGKLFEDLGVPPLNPETDRVMICGSTAMLNDTKALCEAAGLVEGSNAAPGDFVIEKAFVG